MKVQSMQMQRHIKLELLLSMNTKEQSGYRQYLSLWKSSSQKGYQSKSWAQEFKVKRFQQDLDRSISKIINTTMNPFSQSLIEDANFYCLVDGKKASDWVTNDMLSTFNLGRQVEERVSGGVFCRSERFERPLNFARSAVRSKIHGK